MRDAWTAFDPESKALYANQSVALQVQVTSPPKIDVVREEGREEEEEEKEKEEGEEEEEGEGEEEGRGR